MPELRRQEVAELDLIARDLAARPGVESAAIGVASRGPVELLASAHSSSARGAVAEFDLASCAERAMEAGCVTIEPIGTGGEAHVVCTPLRVAGGHAGMLCTQLRGQPPQAGSEILWLLDTYARIASLSLRGDGLLRGVLTDARHDVLTGCMNYATLLNEMAREVQRAERQGLQLACCFLDLDRYKLVNDTFGHSHGDRVLAKVGAALRATVRLGDTIGRYGGDEFVALLPGTGAWDAVTLAERLRSAIRYTPVAGAPDGLDASIGVAEWVPGTGAGRLLGDADLALTAAKAAGGGRVVDLDDPLARVRVSAPGG